MLFRVALVFAIATFVLFEYSDRFMIWLEKPLLRALPMGAQEIYFTGIADKFLVYLKATVFLTLIVTAPYWLGEFCAFGLRVRRKRGWTFWLFPIFAWCFLFVGLAFGYFVMLPVGMDYLLGFASSTEQAWITLTRYYRFVLQTLAASVVLFELPVLILFLGNLGVLHSGFLSERRRWTAFISMLLAFVLAPSPDSLSFLAVLLPLGLLFELSIWMLRWQERRRSRRTAYGM